MATSGNQPRPLSSCSGAQPRGVHPYLGIKEASREAPGEPLVLWGAGTSGEAELLVRTKGRAEVGAGMGKGGTIPGCGVKVGTLLPGHHAILGELRAGSRWEELGLTKD